MTFKILSTLLAGLLFLALPSPGGGAERSADETFDPLRYFEGEWKGDGQGPGGANVLERTYEFVLDGKYLYSENTGTFESEVHRNRDYFSYDRLRETFVLRQFHVEGYVNQYTCEISEAEPHTYVFTSEQIENLEKGWRARLTLTIVGPDEYTETFELAQPGGEWFQLTNGRLKRVK